MTVLERGWLSANNIVFAAASGDTQGSAVVDTGYVSHSAQTLDLIDSALQGQPLARILNTHLHSDHCGGNALLQQTYPEVQTFIAPGEAEHIRVWDETKLSYAPTGQGCPRFAITGLLQPGASVCLSGRDWQIHAAPGHDPHSVILFEPESRTLISADALWENGFGVVFPEIEGIAAFDEVAATLDVIEQLQPLTVVPGHGSVFTDAPAALAIARKRLAAFVQSPERHANYAAKVLLKYKLLEWQSISLQDLSLWTHATSYFGLLHQTYFGTQTWQQWLDSLIEGLIASGAAKLQHGAAGAPVLLNQ
ncbi:MBL fold metallo-hydrolase [Comamonas sp. Y33R10-2]|uniref:MBL fold metallo-hydrolase n=1 Tax=Comamonas sp. Y33R10-2 TaxID=2853257 RepID=UPI001C5C8C75|nr:MBL fold metallo-hydrolase [Comamonas sp. Y33R10-2]QXZ11439.1 MBL fold metallo-hydrolase [Comamonas sp. Y33R10-2]